MSSMLVRFEGQIVRYTKLRTPVNAEDVQVP